jgi:hypothetical protein
VAFFGAISGVEMLRSMKRYQTNLHGQKGKKRDLQSLL